MQITKENIEELILLYVDKELDEGTADALLLYLQQYPEYRELLEAYRDTVLQPDSSIIFEAKDSLKKFVGNSMPFKAPKSRLRMTRAAIVILLLGAGLFTLLFVRNRDHGNTINNTIVLQPDSQKQHILPANSVKYADDTAPDPSDNTVAKKDHAAQQPVKKTNNTLPNSAGAIKPVWPEDKAIAKDTIVMAHILPEKIKTHMPETIDSTVSPAIVSTGSIPQTDGMPELAVNDNREVSSSKGLLPGVVNVVGKIFNHKRKTTKLKINIGNNKEYILSFNY